MKEMFVRATAPALRDESSAGPGLWASLSRPVHRTDAPRKCALNPALEPSETPPCASEPDLGGCEHVKWGEVGARAGVVVGSVAEQRIPMLPSCVNLCDLSSLCSPAGTACTQRELFESEEDGQEQACSYVDAARPRPVQTRTRRRSRSRVCCSGAQVCSSDVRIGPCSSASLYTTDRSTSPG